MSGTGFGRAFRGAIFATLLLAAVPGGVGASGPLTSPPSDTTTLEVRFIGSSTVRGSETNLRAATDPALAHLEDLIDEIDATAIEPLVTGLSQAEATGVAREASKLSGSATGNMADWYRIEGPAGSEASALETLRGSGQVAHASLAPVAMPPPATPDFSPDQLHLDPAPTGVGAEFGVTEPRIRGAGVTVVDLEYDWTGTHEDLQLPQSTDIGGGEYVRYTAFNDEHGTAVLGILGAKDNGFGVTGIVPEATLKGISPTMSDGFGYNPAGALTFLTSRLGRGDVVLIEQQTDGPAPGLGDYLPLEWEQASFDAIRQLGNLGIVVVETGGNGSHDLDEPDMLGRFNRSIRDSGAILVGAGDSVTRDPLWFSSHGSRVDLQGYGNNIVTTGSNGDLQGPGPSEKNVRYTNSFDGTSGAGPIVAGAVAAVLSYLKARGEPPLESAQLIELLRATGTPQPNPGLDQIGPLPDIQAAIALIETSRPSVSITGPADGSGFDFGSTGSLALACGTGSGPELDSCLAVDQGPDGETNLVTGDRLPTDQPGTHVLTATATNRLGLTATDTTTYEVGPGCRISGVALASVRPRGSKVSLIGAADPSSAGRRVKVMRGGTPVGSSTVTADGTIRVIARAPGKKKLRGKARYRLTLGEAHSVPMRPSNAVRVLSRNPLEDAVRVSAKLAGVKKPGRFTLRTHPLCGGSVTSRKVNYNRKGIFTVRLPFGDSTRLFRIHRGGRIAALPVALPAYRFHAG